MQTELSGAHRGKGRTYPQRLPVSLVFTQGGRTDCPACVMMNHRDLPSVETAAADVGGDDDGRTRLVPGDVAGRRGTRRRRRRQLAARKAHVAASRRRRLPG